MVPTAAGDGSRKRVIIVGAGFGGLEAAKRMGHAKDLEVVVLDQKNYHLFQPLLYQVALAALSPADIAEPTRSILRNHRSVHVMMGKAEGVDLHHRILHADCGDFHYDYLVLACGATHSYFGHEEWEEFAPGLKTVEQATEIRRRVLLAFELAERETNLERQRKCLTFVVVGGGPTGVELAGAIAEISKRTLRDDFQHIDVTQARVILLEGSDRILATFPEELSRRAERDLEQLGVTVATGHMVTDVTKDGVAIGETFIPSCSVVWAAGVKPSPLNQSLNTELDRAGRAIVTADLSLPGHPDVFVLGDQAHAKDLNGNPLPGLAPVATQQGRFVADLIQKEIKGNARPVFKYQDKGQLATIGRNKAVAAIGKRQLTGLVAWLAWLLIHVYYLVGFQNKIVVLISWAWSYITYQRGARLIVNSAWRSRGETKPNVVGTPKQREAVR